jgi:hypothetical protein
VIVLASEDAEVYLHALQTMTEQFQLCEWGHFSLRELHRSFENPGMHLITHPVHVLLSKNSAMNGNNGTNRILYHNIAAETITEPSPCFIVGTQSGIPGCTLPSVFLKRKLFLM